MGNTHTQTETSWEEQTSLAQDLCKHKTKVTQFVSAVKLCELGIKKQLTRSAASHHTLHWEIQ